MIVRLSRLPLPMRTLLARNPLVYFIVGILVFTLMVILDWLYLSDGNGFGGTFGFIVVNVILGMIGFPGLAMAVLGWFTVLGFIQIEDDRPGN